MSCRKPCKSCPWKNENQHSLKFRTYVKKMFSIGKKSHKCHVISKDIWGYQTGIDEKNICVGYREAKEK